MSATSSSTPIFIDSDDREIVILRSRSQATTPEVETDVLAEFGDIAIRGTSVDDRSSVRSRHFTSVIEENIKDIAPSSKPTGTKQRDSTRCHTRSLTMGFSSFHLACFCHSYTRCELEVWKPSLIPFCKRKYYRTWVSCYNLFNH